MFEMWLSGFSYRWNHFSQDKDTNTEMVLVDFRMSSSKTGVSIAEMQRELDIKDYKTIWTMAHKIRKAMADRDSQYKLAGLIEMDESFFGASSSGKRGRDAEKKEVVIVAVSTWTDEEGLEHPGFAHAFVIKDTKAETIEGVLKRMTIPDNEIEPLIEKSGQMDGVATRLLLINWE